MFANVSQVDDDDLDFEPPEAKRQRKSLPLLQRSSLASQDFSQRKREIQSQKVKHFLREDVDSLAPPELPGDFDAFSLLEAEAGIDKICKGFFNISQILDCAHSKSLLAGNKVPVTICAVVAYSAKSAHGDAVITVRDRSGTIECCIQKALLKTMQPNLFSIRGAAILLTGPTVLTLRKPCGGLLSFRGGSENSSYYLNVTPNNVLALYCRSQTNANISANESLNSSVGSIANLGLKKYFFRNIVNAANLLPFLKNYVSDFYSSKLPSNSSVNAPVSTVPNSTKHVMEDDDDVEAMVLVASQFDDY